MIQRLVAPLTGLLFGVGLGLSGMTQPTKVIGFLDFFGAWDPSLMFVMLGAIGVHAPIYWWHKKRSSTAQLTNDVDCNNPVPKRSAGKVDVRLIAGAVIFGIGWGMSGYCPGPAVVSLASGAIAPILFVVAMIAGMALVDVLDKRPATEA